LLHGWRFSDENIVELLNRASVMVYSARLEPFGLAPLEANACATPVVAVAEGGVRESIRNAVNGVLIPERRPEQIGQELLSFLETSSYARDISLASRQGLARDPSRGQVG
jgi:glycosyltransferase involved in cell wall biosynthesis